MDIQTQTTTKSEIFKR